ncbi:hypothetical protein [uncultured Desulfobacter sp.]|uniref:hypothetical protein n=1 Tax=uncultured Desulfobacter sp. TaxID=240139 RepID=UPI002D1E4303|nr:hypothetical protein [uncultured Desulfobacter sp.]
MHMSSHLMAGNSRILEEINITKETKEPEGGVIQRKAGTRGPTGVPEETAMYFTLLFKLVHIPVSS